MKTSEVIDLVKSVPNGPEVAIYYHDGNSGKEYDLDRISWYYRLGISPMGDNLIVYRNDKDRGYSFTVKPGEWIVREDGVFRSGNSYAYTVDPVLNHIRRGIVEAEDVIGFLKDDCIVYINGVRFEPVHSEEEWSVIYVVFKVDGKLYKANGYHDSMDGPSIDIDSIEEVFPYEVTTTKYGTKEELEPK